MNDPLDRVAVWVIPTVAVVLAVLTALLALVVLTSIWGPC